MNVCIHCIEVFLLETKYLLGSAFNNIFFMVWVFLHVDVAYGVFFCLL